MLGRKHEDDRPPTLAEATQAALYSIGRVFDEHIVFPSPEARDAVVLWTAHAWVSESFYVTPRLSLRSNEPGSGKSVVLEIIENLSPNPVNAVNMTPGTLWRLMEHSRPTLIFDECDTIFGKNGSGSAYRVLRGVINAGYRRGAKVPRCVGAEDVKMFSVFGPIALGGLGRLPDTIASRSWEIEMRRMQAGDREVRPFRLQFAEAGLKIIRERLEAWSKLAGPELRYAAPEVPGSNRAAEIWLPGVAIAELAGEDWAARARAACVALTAKSANRETSIGVQLLRDIATVFEGYGKLFTAELLERLYDLRGGVWAPATLDGRKLATLLGEYGVKPGMLRDGASTGRGYRSEQFEDAWERNLVPEKVEA